MGFRLIWKFIIVYILIAVVTFVLITLVGGRMIENSIIENYSKDFYSEAKSIAKYHFADEDNFITEEMFDNLSATASYQNLTILINDQKGRVLVNTDLPYDELGQETIEHEIRLTVMPFEVPDFELIPKYHISRERIKKYYPLDLKKMCSENGVTVEDLIIELIIGPESTQSPSILRDYLNDMGFPKLAGHITTSDCPLRSKI